MSSIMAEEAIETAINPVVADQMRYLVTVYVDGADPYFIHVDTEADAIEARDWLIPAPGVLAVTLFDVLLNRRIWHWDRA